MIPSLQTATTFCLTSVLLALAPGPDNIFVLTQSALHGRHAGLVTTFGLMTGVLVHTAVVALGMAAVFQTSALAFAVLKYAGALYLGYLAWMAFRARGRNLDLENKRGPRLRSLYVRGILMNVTNPKVSIFFLAFLPQFVAPEKGAILGQFFMLGLLFILSAALVFGTIAMLAGTLGGFLNRSPRVQVLLNRLSGLVFLALALKIATAQR